MAQNNIPVREIYRSLVLKGDQKFRSYRDLPDYGRAWYNSYFKKVLKVYENISKFENENRQELAEAGVKRWERGEIGFRFAQLHFALYTRTSEERYLYESCLFFENVLSGEYFNDDSSSQDPHLSLKQLNCVLLFLTACLVANRMEMVNRLVNQLEELVKECVRKFQEIDFKECEQVVQDIVRYLQVDLGFMNIRSLRYSGILDSDPDSLPHVSSKRHLKLQDAILSSCHHNQVEFMDLTLDTLRMLQCLEWEPTVSFYHCSKVPGANVSNVGHGGAQEPNIVNYWHGMTDQMLGFTDKIFPPNPWKSILNNPPVTHFTAVLATICENLPPDGVALIYLSASEKEEQILPSSSATQMNTNNSTVCNFQTHGIMSYAHCTSSLSTQHDILTHFLWMGFCADEGLNRLYPSDLIPFTRRPLFLIIDSDDSQIFKGIHGAEQGEPLLMLLSPSCPSPVIGASVDSSHQPSGSQFTMFLTAPLQAFCYLVGFSGFSIEKDAYERAEKSLSTSLNYWGLTLATSEALNPVWAQVLCDPFLRRLLLRFIFYQAVITLYVPTFRKTEFLPSCLPLLPGAVMPEVTTSQTAIKQIANIFGVAKYFKFFP